MDPGLNRGIIQGKLMKSSGKEYLGLLCKVYLCAVLGAIPLYMRNGYWKLGDAKYVLYRNIAIICLILGLCASIIWLLGLLQEQSKIQEQITIPEHKKWNWKFKKIYGRFSLSWIDIFMLLYLIANLFSYLRSEYPSTALWGSYEWYMGFFSQFLFVGSYFMLSRGYDGSLLPLRCGQAVLLSVALLGIGNRLKWDPLHLFVGMTSLDWDYNHLISTVGNINWLTGYLCVTIPLAAAEYFRTKKQGVLIFLYITTLSGFFILLIQGSDSGLMVAALALVLMGGMGLRSQSTLHRFWLLLIGLCLFFVVMSAGIEIRGSWHTFPYDDKSRYLMQWKGWLVLSLILAASYPRLCNVSMERLRKGIVWCGASAILIMILCGGWYFFKCWKLDYGWGSGRGGLWVMAIYSFQLGDLPQKLFGVGPDCYGEYIYRKFVVTNFMRQKGRFEQSIFVNAHNEWLNQLVNTGIFGVISYAGIFLSSFLRFLRREKQHFLMDAGIMALLLYGLNSLVSFQQVMNAPILFLILGIVEKQCRCLSESGDLTLTKQY